MHKPFSIWEKNDYLRVSFSSYSEQSILSSELTSLFWWFCLAQIHIYLNFHLDICGKNKYFLFALFDHQGKKQSCNFSHCKIFSSSLGCFLISSRWSSETTLYTQFGLSRCFCSKCSFTCSTSLKKNFLWWYFFGEVLLTQNCS